MRLHLRTPVHTIVWLGSSTVFGMFLLWFAAAKNLTLDPTTRTFNLIVLIISWLLGVLLLRLFIGGLGDPTSTAGLIFKRKRR